MKMFTLNAGALMDIAKPDEVGEMGEEALGTVSLPRPEAFSGCLVFLIYTLLTIYLAFVGWGLENILVVTFHWSKQDASNVMDRLNPICILAILLAYAFYKRSLPTSKLHIERGRSDLVASDEQFEIWSGPYLYMRVLSPIYWAAVGIFLIAVGLEKIPEPNRLVNIGCISFGVALCVFAVTFLIRPIFHPLLKANAAGVSILGRFVEWKQLQGVEVEHLTNLDGGFSAAKLTLFGLDGGRMCSVSLPKEMLSVPEEKDLLEFFASRLGRRVLPVAPYSPDWI